MNYNNSISSFKLFRGVDDMEDKILDKLKKLTLLAESSNINEAENATKLVQDLLVKYNIELSKVDGYKIEDQYVNKTIAHLNTVSDFKRQIMCLLQDYFFVTTITTRGRHSVERKRTTKIQFLGKKSSVEVAHYMFNFLDTEIVRLYKVDKRKNPHLDKIAYFVGCVWGLRKQLENQKKEQISNSSTSIVWLKDENLENFVSAECPKLKIRTNKQHTNLCGLSYYKGYAVGGEVNLNSALNGEVAKDLRIGV